MITSDHLSKLFCCCLPLTALILLEGCVESAGQVSTAAFKSSLPAPEDVQLPDAELSPPSETAPQTAPPPPTITDVEVVWAVPTEPVEGYVIHYGLSKTTLTLKDRVNVERLERIEDPVRGALFRYLLKGVPTDRAIYVSVAAFEGEEESEPSEILEVPPENN